MLTRRSELEAAVLPESQPPSATLSEAAPPCSNASTSIVLEALFSIINLGTLLLTWRKF
jgi:hypothetical protein